MKYKLTLTAVAALIIAASPAYALSKSQVASIKAALNVPAPEMPAKAVEVVKAAPEKEREDVALTAVRMVVAKHPGAAPVVVAAISKEMPELSAAVAKAAVLQAPEQRGAITLAASQAAPSQAVAISTGAAQASSSGSFATASANAELPSSQFRNDSLAAFSGNAAAGAEIAIRGSAGGQGNGHGKAEVRPGPVRYHKPLPVPPRRPIFPPGLKKFGEPREF